MMYRDFMDAGYRIFGLHKITDEGCACGDPECPTIGKHPVASNWQHSPDWSDEQIEVMEMTGQLSTGYGVLVAGGLLVVDVDARNGGVASYEKLAEAVPQIGGAGLVVNTGSGGGSRHLYFRVPDDVPFVQSLPEYPGIDFKSTGYVVGPGSLHKSGATYDAVIGQPCDIGTAPEALVDLLRKPERYRSKDDNGAAIDYTLGDLRSMVMAIPNDDGVGHEQYIRIGMGLHEATGGADEAFDIWQEWARKSSRHGKNGRSRIENRWHSFGKASNPVTVGTLKHYAEQAGWREPVTFTSDWQPISGDDPLDLRGVDLLRPPGFVGDVAAWINRQSLFPRENLAVAAALMVVSNCGGMRYSDPLDHSSFNLFCFGVADSSTGKEAILQGHNDLIRAAGLSGALVGGIKSEQEIYRNLVRHQAAFYAIDELGEVFGKITSASKRGGAVYLEGVIGTLMAIYSKSNSFVPVTGDLKEEIRNALQAEYGRLQKAIDNNEDKTGVLSRKLERVSQQLDTVDMGIENPFLSIFGVTTPEKFNSLMNFDMAANGFMGRALIFRELEKNPRIRPRASRRKEPVPDAIKFALLNLYAPGHFDVDAGRIERIGEKSHIATTEDAAAALDQVGDAFWESAEEQKELTGLHPIPRRGYELTAKVSAVLAMPSGLRTVEHVRWAYALVKRDIDGKMRLAHSNSALEKQDALCSKILSLVSAEHGETIGAITRQCRDYAKADVHTAIDKMVKAGALREEAVRGRGRPTKQIFSV